MAILEHMRLSVADVKNKLPALIKAVEGGESVTICRRGVPVVDIIPTATTTAHKPKLGTMSGKIVIHDPDWWKPMIDEEAEGFIKTGRYWLRIFSTAFSYRGGICDVCVREFPTQ